MTLLTPEQKDRLALHYRKSWEYYTNPTPGIHGGFYRFLRDCVFTTDEEADPDAGETVIKRFPVDNPYVQYKVEHVTRQRLVAEAKSRRMIATWFWAAHAVWNWLRDRRNVVWQSQKAEKSADTLKNKMLFIIQHLPHEHFAPFVDQSRPNIPAGWTEDMVNWMALSHTGGSGLSTITRMVKQADGFRSPNSRIIGLGEGADQWRQYTVSNGYMDEYGFWESAADSLKGARPAVGLRGQLILISSANPGFMKALIAPPERAPGELKPEPPTPDSEGIETWTSNTGFFVMRLHYTADPDKRSPEWTEWPDANDPLMWWVDPRTGVGKFYEKGLARKGYDRNQWNQEMEIDFTVHSGRPFYPEYQQSLHRRSLNPIKNVPLVLGFDFGITPATTIHQIAPTGHLLTLGEVVSDTNGITQHCEILINILDTEYPWWRKSRKKLNWLIEDDELEMYAEAGGRTAQREMIISYVDPAGEQRSQVDLQTPISILQNLGLNPIALYETQSPAARMEATKWWLSRMLPYQKDAVLPAWLIDRSCERLHEALKGGAKIGKIKRFLKEKNEHSHVMESAEYPLTALYNHVQSGAASRRRPLGAKPHIQRIPEH